MNRLPSFVIGVLFLTSISVGQSNPAIDAAVTKFRAGKSEDALKDFEQMLPANRRNPDVLGWIGFLHLRANRAAEAVPFLEQAFSYRPADLEISINLGNAYKATGQFDKALTRYKIAESLAPSMFEPHYNSGTIWIAKSLWKQAIAEFEIAAKLKSDDAFVYNNLGFAYEAEKNLAKATDYYKRAADLRKDNKTLSRNAGLKLAKQRRFSEAIEYLQRAGTDESAVGLALADAYTQVGKLTEALALYEKIKESQRKNPVYWFNLGVVRSQLNDDRGAEAAYANAIELAPNDLDTLNNIGLLQFKKGAFAEAADTFEKLAGLNPRSVSAKVNWGAAEAKAGDLRKAIVAWKYALKEDPNRTTLKLDLANLLWQTGDSEQARSYYTQVLASEPNNADALNGTGLCYLKDEKLPQAEAAFRASIDAQPKVVGAYNNLAVVLEKMHQREAAIKILQTALSLAPADKDIQRNLDRLRAGG